VTGYVLLAYIHNVDVIPLVNLRVIRGHSLFRVPNDPTNIGYSLFVANVAMREIQLTSLHGEILFHVFSFVTKFRIILFNFLFGMHHCWDVISPIAINVIILWFVCLSRSCIVLKRQKIIKILIQFLLHTTAQCLFQIVLKFGLHQSTPSFPDFATNWHTTLCWVERRRDTQVTSTSTQWAMSPCAKALWSLLSKCDSVISISTT